MAAQATGGIKVEKLANGTIAFRLRFKAYGKRQSVRLHEARDCDCGCGGGWNERTARVELDRILACVKAGVWEAPARTPRTSQPVDSGAPVFLDYSSRWLQAKIDGVNGEKPIRKNTIDNYRWRLESHVLPFFASYRLDEIDRDLCLAFKAHLLKQARELRQAIDAGADLRDERNQKIVPLSPTSIRKAIDTLAAILDEAVEDGHLDSNPARGKKMKVHVAKPKRTFLEMDELAALIDAAAEQDISPGQPLAPIELGLSAAMVAQLFSQGRSPKQIATQLGLAKSTVSHYLKRLGLNVGRGYVGRRVVVEILGRGGPRASELCDIKIGHLRLHDPAGARFAIPDSKTEKGIREVEMTPDLAEVVACHIERLRALGLPTGPDAYLVPNLKGGRMSYGRVEQIVRDAAALASERLLARGMAPLPHVTPHTLRRTYISIALPAYDWDVKYVMDQVGHEDSKVTLDIYAQMQKRAKRDHGAKFDKLVRDARELLQERPKVGSEEPIGTAMGTAWPKLASRRGVRATRSRAKTRRFAGDSAMEPAGIEPATSCLQSRRSPS